MYPSELSLAFGSRRPIFTIHSLRQGEHRMTWQTTQLQLCSNISKASMNMPSLVVNFDFGNAFTFLRYSVIGTL